MSIDIIYVVYEIQEEGVAYMIEQSLNTYAKNFKDEDTKVVYNLIFKNALYSFECYKDASDELYDYCYLEDFTEDEGEADAFLKKMIKGKVKPVHIKDIAEDYFN